ncbi:energy-coupling factor transporter transmembrane protein EcfT [Cellulomonas sp. JZ18]|uniref:energy-coupling factor transporter transmembrane component T family protein n=1 Tax=Cellulomonas sp. JZ18 TaxID=2654191 RepID=UPI0012D4ABFC|nr:energy-coupling factor transporter transmembrane component T [Cellulomonas sp. JZ18]QGQ18779.1 energy-coupling factor transporter transmembrane protein EcfT [Cellulomonas sp. JZ18]
MSAAAAVAQAWAPDVRPGVLRRLNPLSKVAATLPATVLLVVWHEPVAALVLAAAAAAVLLGGGGLPARVLVGLLVVGPLAAVAVGVALGLWVAPTVTAGSPVLVRLGPLAYTQAALAEGLGTVARLYAVLLLASVGGLTTTGPDLVRAAQQHLRVPYRVGWTALAAFRFVPRFGHELAVIRAAHRVRGTDTGTGPVADLRRYVGYAVPLLAGALRHAERVALAMDARGFGAHPTRTERHRVPWRARDTALVALTWAGTLATWLLLR